MLRRLAAPIRRIDIRQRPSSLKRLAESWIRTDLGAADELVESKKSDPDPHTPLFHDASLGRSARRPFLDVFRFGGSRRHRVDGSGTSVGDGDAVTAPIDADEASYDSGTVTLDVGDQNNINNAQLDLAADSVWALVYTIRMQ